MKHPIHPEPIPHEEKHGYTNPMEKPYKFPSVPRWLGSLIGMIVSALFLWWPNILRMLNAIVQ